MTELPPDPTRLRAILAYLDQQITDNDTIGFYLQLQRDTVRQALDHTAPEPEPKPRRRGRLPKGATGLPTFARAAGSSGFCVEQQPRAVGPEPLRIHVDDCSSVTESTPISAQDARAALLDPSAGCQFCRPDLELGIDGD